MKLKKILLPFLSLVVIITVMAFTLPGKLSSAAKSGNALDPYAYYFKYIGPVSFDYSTVIDPSNYELINISDPNWELCDYGTEVLCAILCERYWDGSEWRPDFDAAAYPGSTKQQLYNYSQSGMPGGGLVFLKDE